MLTDLQLADGGVDISHHFGGKAYIKATHIAKGITLGQHAHEHAHLSVLVSGRVRVYIDGVPQEREGYCVMTIEAHHEHMVEALEDSVWLCVWGTECDDPKRVDEAILSGI